MKRIIIIIIIVIVVLLLPLLYYLCSIDKTNDQDKYSIEFNLTIDVDSKKNYTIYLPVPIKSKMGYNVSDEGTPIDFMNQLEPIEKDAKISIDIIDQEYYLNVTSGDDVTIKSEELLKNTKGNWFIKLSSNSVIIHCYNENFSFEIDYMTKVEKLPGSSSGFEFANRFNETGKHEIDITEFGEIVD